MLQESLFSERYGQLADDELARIALSGNLVPDAREALNVELRKRGMTDLKEYKRALEEAAAASSPESEMAYQMQVKQKFAEAMFVFMAWIFAAALPFISTSVNRPTGSDAMKLYSIITIILGFSCYLGTRARRRGSRRGYVLKLIVPLLLLATSTVVVLSIKALQARF